MTDKAVNLAQRLFEARRSARKLEHVAADLMPQTPDDAYAIQDATMALAGDVGGWKLAVARSGNTPKCAPIPKDRMLPSPATIKARAFMAEKAETEIAVTFKHSFVARGAPYQLDEVLAGIGSICVSMEILGSRFADQFEAPPLAGLADLLSNACIVIGEPVEDWIGLQWEAPRMTLRVDGSEVRSADGSHPRSAVMDSLVWLVNFRQSTTRPVLAGHVVITGAPNMRAAPIAGASTVEAAVEGIGEIRLDLT